MFSTKSVSESVSIEAFLVLERKSITRCAMVFKYSDSKCGVSRLDFGSFTSDIIHDKLCFEHDLLVYVHQDCERPDLSYCKQSLLQCFRCLVFTCVLFLSQKSLTLSF